MQTPTTLLLFLILCLLLSPFGAAGHCDTHAVSTPPSVTILCYMNGDKDLANMVEVGYTLSDVTRYLVASQDEIRLVNEPPG